MAPSLGRLKTDLGERSNYDAASQCSRCGYCEQACPTYRLTGDESKSPRGRNQLVRLMLEGKLKDPSAAEEALSSCLLCGACSTTCYAHVPTAEIVLEGRRLLRGRAHPLVGWVTRLLVASPRRFETLIKAAFLLKRLGLSALGRPLLRAFGLSGLAEADRHLRDCPRELLVDALRRRPSPPRPEALYFAACGTNLLFPEVGRATLEALERTGRPAAWLKDAGCCGLLSYNYGELEDARKAARRVIEAAEKSPDLPIAVDCSSCAAHLKNYEQLFLDDPGFKSRAKAFGERIKDALELFDGPAQRRFEDVATYHESCRACHGQGLKTPSKLMESACSKFVPLADADSCCGGAGAFAFTQPELSDEVLKQKIERIAATKAKFVVTSSTSCLLQLAHGLRKYYPWAKVLHVSELASRAVDGKKPAWDDDKSSKSARPSFPASAG